MDIRRIQQLQDVSADISSLHINTPQIVVIGSQSSGKSSVLEQIIKREILPRDTNLTTRCPIVLYLRRCRDGRECVVFDHLTEPIYDFGVVSTLITQRMIDICGSNKGISNRPITLSVNLKNTLEMTLVDLPGLVKVPIGEQPEDIETQVEKMVLDYATRDATIILALVNANADIATNEALKIAKRADPQLRRTLGVVTKIDLMDSGTDCMDILTNGCPKLALGYVGVVNRGRQEILGGISIAEAVSNETLYFRQSPVYGRLYPAIGSEYLVKRLNEIFCKIVFETLPVVKSAVRDKLSEKAQRLCELRLGQYENRSLISSYHQTLQSIFRHTRFNDLLFVRNSSCLPADFKTLFHNKEPPLDFGDIPSRLRSSSYLFISEPVFEDVVKENIKRMAEFYLEKVEATIRMLLDEVMSVSSARFEVLARKLNSVVCDAIEAQRLKLIQEIRTYAAILASHINVDRPEFDKNKALDLIMHRSLKCNDSGLLGLFNISKGISPECKNPESDLIRELAASYLSIVNREMVSYVVNAIYYYLHEYVDTKLLDVLAGIDLESSMLEESPEVVQKGKRLEEDIKVLEAALVTLNDL